MDAELFAWLAEVESLDATDHDALWNALLSGSPRGLGACGSGVDSHEQQLFVASQPSIFTEAATDAAFDGGGAAAANAEPTSSTDDEPERAIARARAKKRKKHSSWRAKDEIERLRQSVVDLEAVIALRMQRRPDARAFARVADKPPVTTEIGVWSGVAARQTTRLRESLRENQWLRVRMQHQLAITKRLARLVQRVRDKMSSHAIPQNPLPLDEAIILFKQQKLVAAVGAIFQSIGDLQTDGFFQQSSEEFRTTRTFAKLRDWDVKPGQVLARSRACRIVPVNHARLSDQLWGQLQQSDIEGIRWVSRQHIEHTGEFHMVVQSFEAPMAQGSALFRAIGVRARTRREGAGDVIVAAGSLWLDTSSGTAAVGFDQHSWTIAQPHEATPGLTDVIFHAESSCNEAGSSSSGSISDTVLVPQPPCAALLDNFVSDSQAHMLNENDRCLDGIMLASN